MTNIEPCIRQVDASLYSVSLDALLLQGEANAILEQQVMFIRNEPVYHSYATNVNIALKQTKEIAKVLSDDFLQNLLTSISKLQNYFFIHNSVITNTAKEASREEWTKNLELLQSTATICQRDIIHLVSSTTGFLTKLTKITSYFSQTVKHFNTAINGDNGLLSAINNKLKTVNSTINGTFAAVLAANLLIIVSEIIILTGSVASRRTWSQYLATVEGFKNVGIEYYTNWKLIAPGIIAAGLGIGSSLGSLIELNNLFKKKSEILFTQSSIDIDVKLALGLNHSCENLERKTKKLSNHLKKLITNWHFLTNSIKKAEDNLRSGCSSTEEIYVLFSSSKHSISKSLDNINIVKNKISGVKTIKGKKDQTIGEMILRNVSATLA